MRWLLRNGKADRFAPASTLVGTRPGKWWQATDRAMKALGDQHSLQTLKHWVLPARCTVQPYWMPRTVITPCHFVERRALCARVRLLEARVPQSRVITGNLMMPGLLRLNCYGFSGMSRRYSVKSQSIVTERLLASAYDGGVCQHMSDAAGTMWLDVAKRDWSDTCCRLATYLVTRCPHYTKAANYWCFAT